MKRHHALENAILRCPGLRCGLVRKNKKKTQKHKQMLTCFFTGPFFLFAPFPGHPFLPFSRHVFAIFCSSKSALFCRAKGTAQSLERGSSWMDLSSKFGKEIPSRNLREKRSECAGSKCSKSRDLTAIAICDSNRESQITSDLRQCEPSQKSPLL